MKTGRYFIKAFDRLIAAEVEADRMARMRSRFEKHAKGVSASKRYKNFSKAMKDFWGGRIPLLVKSNVAAQFIIENSRRKSELVYHIWANPALGRRILKMKPTEQLSELALIDHSLRHKATLPKPLPARLKTA